jgi:hypothetical protein
MTSIGLKVMQFRFYNAMIDAGAVRYVTPKKGVVMSKISGMFVVLSLSFLFFGCSSNSVLINTWGDSTIKKDQINRVLVVAINKDPAIRRIWEDVFTGELNKHGVIATASYMVFKEETPRSNQILETVKAKGYNGILVTHRLPVEAVTNTTPTYVSMEPDFIMTENRYVQNEFWPGRNHISYSYYQYWPQYYAHYSQVIHYGTTEIQKYHCKLITMWTTGTNGRIVWSSTSKSLEDEAATPESYEKTRMDVVNLVIPELVRLNIIPEDR